MQNIRHTLLTTLIIFLSIVSYGEVGNSSDKDSLILASIEAGQLDVLSDFITQNEDINRLFGNQERSLLCYSIEHKQADIAEFLLENGASFEVHDGTKTPLMFAARYGETEILKLLIDWGADINAINKSRNTAFHYAAKYNRLDILKILYNNGAKINIPNNEQWTALDYSIINSKPEIQEYLRFIGCVLFDKVLPNYFDGPYIELENDSTLRIDYLVNKKGKHGSTIYTRKVVKEDKDLVLTGFKNDKNVYPVLASHSTPPSLYNNSEKVFVIGDIHGQYIRMIEMLKKGGVINNKLKWKWGDGHLVFVGDIMDRGEGVQEALWFIYKLEQEARKYNGRVHLLLGNHEAMILKNDIRYIANKYYSLCSNLDRDYHDLYSKNTVLGDWLRTKNVVEIIGNSMFIHAGISEELLSKDLTVDEINNAFRHFLNCEDKTLYTEMDKFMISNYGPVWYRGYLKGSSGYKEIDQEALNRILTNYNVDRVFIGHTEVDFLKPEKNNKVYPVNIPLANRNIPGQALLIENNSIYRITIGKSPVKLNYLPK